MSLNVRLLGEATKKLSRISMHHEMSLTQTSSAAEEEEEVGQSFRTRHFVQEEQPTLGMGMTKLHYTRLNYWVNDVIEKTFEIKHFIGEQPIFGMSLRDDY